MSTLLSYIVWDPDQVMFHVGHFGLRWYSMCWLMGLLLGYLLMQRLYKQQHIPDEGNEPAVLLRQTGHGKTLLIEWMTCRHCIMAAPSATISLSSSRRIFSTGSRYSSW